MRNTNFRNEKTGEEFFFTQYTIKDGKYYNRWREEILDPNTKEPLSLIQREGPIKAPLVLGSTQERYQKDISHYKQIAKKHAQSEESKGLKKKVIEREMGVAGYEKKNTNIKEI